MNMIASTVGAAAVAAPSLALAGSDPSDPIFGAIASHRTAWASWLEAAEAHRRLQEQVPAAIRRSPRIAVPIMDSPADMGKSPEGLAVRWCETDEEVAEMVPEWLKGDEAKEFVNRAVGQLDADAEQLAVAQDESGWTAVVNRYDDTHATAGEALTALALTIPTTAEGMRAAMQYWWEHQREQLGVEAMPEEMRETMRFMSSLHVAVGTIAERQAA